MRSTSHPMSLAISHMSSRVEVLPNNPAQVGTVFQPLVTYEDPPTYFHTSKVTNSFQEIVHAYGIARYREVNPTVFTIVTFPFLFAVMFGDMGHGFLMLLFALYMVGSEASLGKQQLNEIFEMAFGGGFIILCIAWRLYSKFFNKFMLAQLSSSGSEAPGVERGLPDVPITLPPFFPQAP